MGGELNDKSSTSGGWYSLDTSKLESGVYDDINKTSDLSAIAIKPIVIRGDVKIIIQQLCVLQVNGSNATITITDGSSLTIYNGVSSQGSKILKGYEGLMDSAGNVETKAGGVLKNYSRIASNIPINMVDNGGEIYNYGIIFSNGVCINIASGTSNNNIYNYGTLKTDASANVAVTASSAVNLFNYNIIAGSVNLSNGANNVTLAAGSEISGNFNIGTGSSTLTFTDGPKGSPLLTKSPAIIKGTNNIANIGNNTTTIKVNASGISSFNGKSIVLMNATASKQINGMPYNSYFDNDPYRYTFKVENKQLIAAISPVEYNLIYNLNGGELSGNTSNVTVGKLIQGTYALDLTGMTHGKVNTWDVLFLGWTSDTNTLGKIYGCGDVVPKTINKVTISTADVTVYAAWSYDKNGNGIPDTSESEYTLTYNLNGGELGGSTGNVAVGNMLPNTYPLDLTGATHSKDKGWDVLFLGWTSNTSAVGKIYENGNKVPTMIDRVTISNADVTVYAVWGYDKNGNGIPDVDENVYTLTYNLNGGEHIGNTSNVTVKNMLPNTYPLDLTGVTHGKVNTWDVLFLGWTSDIGTVGKIYGSGDIVPTMITDAIISNADVNVYAVWAYDKNGNGIPDTSESEHLLIYNLNGGELGGSAENVTVEDMLPGAYMLDLIGVTHVKVSGWDVMFLGWTFDIGTVSKIYGSGDIVPMMIDRVIISNADVTVYAVWGYDKNGNGIPDVEEIEYTLTYNLNGGELGGSTSNVTVEDLLPSTYQLNLTGVTHGLDSGWDVMFLGWTIDTGAFNRIFGSGNKVPTMINKVTISNADVTVYAVWAYDKNSNGIPDTSESEQSIIYSLNGGELGGSIGDVAVENLLPGTYPLDLAGVTHGLDSGWDVLFLGWTSNTSAVGKIYGSGEKVPTMINEVTISNADVIVYAVWAYDKNSNGIPDTSESEHSLIYNLNGGELGGSTGNVTVGNLLPGTYPLDLTGVTHGLDSGWDVLFIGWTLDISTLSKIYGNGEKVPTMINEVTISNAGATVYAVWAYDKNSDGVPDIDESTFSLIYNLNGGSYNSNVGDVTFGNLLHGTHPLDLAGVTRGKVSGWDVIFLGWTLDTSALGETYGSGSTVPAIIDEVVVLNADVTVFAVWAYDKNGNGISDTSESEHSLIYNLNGGELGGSTSNVTVGNLLPNKYPLDLTGVTHGLDSGWDVMFLGWTSNTSAVGKIYGSGDKVPVMTYKVTISNADVTVYAVWAYDKNGNGIPDTSESEYILTYNLNGGEIGGNTFNVTVGNLLPNKYPLDLTGVTRGKVGGWDVMFLGWTSQTGIVGKIYGSGDKVPTMTDEVIISNADVTVYAVWAYDKNGNGIPDTSETEYSLIYDLNGGSRNGSTSNVMVKNLLPDTYLLDLTGVTRGKVNGWDVMFFGWTLDVGAFGRIYGSGDVIPQLTDDVTISSSDVIVYVVWSYDKNGNGIPDVEESKYSLIYNLNGGSYNSNVGDVTFGNLLPSVYSLKLTDVTHGTVDGWDIMFLGWTQDISTLGEIYKSGDTVPYIIKDVTISSVDMTVYAVWSYDKNGNSIPDVEESEYTLTYDPNGGSRNGSTGSVTVENLLPNAYLLDMTGMTHDTVNGWDIMFLGWTVDIDAVGKIYGSGDKVPAMINEAIISDADMTLYAVWSYDKNGNSIPDVEESEYTLIYNLNGGKFGGNTDNVTMENLLPNTYKLDLIGMTHDAVNGWDILFFGWTPDVGAAGKIYGSGDATPILIDDVTISNADITVYAVWSYDKNNNEIPDVLEDLSEKTRNYYITATSDSGSTISPKGVLAVPYESNMTFLFFAKEGYEIVAVYVDGVAIPSAYLESGSYTFVGLLSNHSIRVESKTSSGGGIGSGGDGEDGSDTADKGNWSVTNIVCAILSLFVGIVAVIAFRKDNKGKRSKTTLVFRVLALIIGIVSVAVFFLTEDLSMSAAVTDGWTLPMAVLLFAAIIAAAVGFRFDGGTEEDN